MTIFRAILTVCKWFVIGVIGICLGIVALFFLSAIVAGLAAGGGEAMRHNAEAFQRGLNS